jgi:hypothetical protein
MLTDIAYDIGDMLDGKMHQTTLRLSPDLWQALEEECKRLGVSVAQYLREAAVARLAYTAGRRGVPEYEAALEGAGSPLSDSLALTAQSAMARRQARHVREHSQRLRMARLASRT